MQYVTYKGKKILKNPFSAFVYDDKGNRALVQSWYDYTKHISSGVWFDEKPSEKIEEVSKVESENAKDDICLDKGGVASDDHVDSKEQAEESVKTDGKTDEKEEQSKKRSGRKKKKG